MKYYGYNDLETDTKQLIAQLRDKKIDTIVALARGGMIIAQLISYALDIRDIQTLKVESYDDDNHRDSVLITNDIKIKENSTILVVDDIVDSGDTLKAVLAHINKKALHVEVLSCSIFYKKSACIEPDFKVKEATEWINFFWEVDFLE